MSVLICIETQNNAIKKNSLEAISFGVELASQMGTKAAALLLGESSADINSLGEYGISKLFTVSQLIDCSDTQQVSFAVSEIAQKNVSTLVVFSNTSLGKSVAPRVSIRLNAGLVSGITSMPKRDEGFVVRKNVFSGKAFVNVNIHTKCKVLVVESNCFEVKKNQTSLEVENVDIAIPAARVVLKQRNNNEGGISLAEADKVVSAGRGMKGPENWGMIEEMAQLLGAATACSRPVADSHWRPHHEHVGQTGVAIAPNLYIAIGISGAIQHLAGVNRSKTIVVINKDPEAPFFKAADYGIVGDAFEVVPKINQALKELA